MLWFKTIISYCSVSLVAIGFVLSLNYFVAMNILIIISCAGVIGFCGSEFIQYTRNNYDLEYSPTILYFPSAYNDNDYETLVAQFLNFALELGINGKPIPKILSDRYKKNNLSNVVQATKWLKHFKNMIVVNLKIPGKSTIEEILRDRDVFEKYDSSQENQLMWIFDCEAEEDENCFRNDYKIVSQNILKHKPLWEYIRMNKTTMADHKILVCIPKPYIKEQYNTISAPNGISLSIEHCDENTQIGNYLAIIANKPLMTDTEVPTVFYQTPYILQETKDYFPNSLSLSGPWLPLKHAFVSFLKRMGWYRVAIVSDDSEYSEAFLDELVPLLLRESIVFTAQNCDGKLCDFEKVFQRLLDSEVRIIILNLNSIRHAERIRNAMEYYKLRPIKWIVRDWPFQKNQPPRDVYSITLLPKSEIVPYSSTITECLTIIHKIYKSVLSDPEIFKRNFVDLFNQEIRQQHNIVRVCHHRAGMPPTDVADIEVVGSDARIISFSLPEPAVPDVVESCIVRSGDFFKPCAHDTLLLLLVVCIMFALTMLVIVVYFNAYKTQRCYSRFQ